MVITFIEVDPNSLDCLNGSEIAKLSPRAKAKTLEMLSQNSASKKRSKR